ncbi:MAG: sulfite exporter TauE/SafE family protein [Propionibacterium sp.]|nr:sulfite exporter TauE/SafE family protein [Propionibacterium sp.]
MSIAFTAVIVGAAVMFGAATQRLTGMGFALVAAPALVLVLGAGTGVPLIQVLSFFVSFSVLVFVIRDVAWTKALLLMVPAALGIVPGWWLSNHVPSAWLLIIIGLLVIAAILAMLADERARVFKGSPGMAAAGFLSGFMNVTAGVGGPAIVLYKLSNAWPHKQFVATVQVYFMALNTGSLIAHGLPTLPMPVWITAFAALATGIVVGHSASAKVPARVASRLVVLVALVGSLATILQGLIQLN